MGQMLSGRRNPALHRNISLRGLCRNLSEMSLLKMYLSKQFLIVSPAIAVWVPSEFEYVSRQSLRACEFAWR